MAKRFFAILVLAALLVCTIPTVAMAEEDSKPPKITTMLAPGSKVRTNDCYAYSKNLDDVDQRHGMNCGCWTWEEDWRGWGTLVLNGVTIDTTAEKALTVPVGTTIIIKGNNYIRSSSGIAINGSHDVLIKGSGTLTCDGKTYGISASNGLVISMAENGKLVVKGGIRAADCLDVVVGSRKGLFKDAAGKTVTYNGSGNPNYVSLFSDNLAIQYEKLFKG